MRPKKATPPREVWCDEHRRPVGPDGRCALCVEAEAPAQSERRVVLIVVAVAFLLGIGPASYYFFWAGHAEDRRAVEKAEKRAAREAEAKRKLAAVERWVDEVKPSTGVVDPKDLPQQATPRKRRVKRRARRRRSRAMRPRRAAPRPAERVAITMYMAHW